MIDLHAHILPGLDDGAVDLAMSLELARIYAAAGFKYVVATPHAVVGEMPGGYARAVRAMSAQFNRALQERAIALRVLPGMEVTLDPRLPQLVAEGTVLTLGGSTHLLVETPFGRLPLGWRNLVFDLAARGVTVLFAHPERCEQIMRDPSILNAMVAAGARLQVNWDSFTGVFGPRSAHLARRMAEQGLIHCLATDSHDPQNRHAGRIDLVRDELGERIGAANLRRISLENPVRVLRKTAMLDMDLSSMPVREEKRSGWRRWFTA